jgi:alkylhydroperoxidase family enzyme
VYSSARPEPSAARSPAHLPPREIVIDRVRARCGCEYEWGVHVAYFAARVGLTAEQIASIAVGRPNDPVDYQGRVA